MLHEAELHRLEVILLFLGDEAVVREHKPSPSVSQSQYCTDRAKQHFNVWREQWARVLRGTRIACRTSGAQATVTVTVRPRGSVLQKVQQQGMAAICCSSLTAPGARPRRCTR